MTKQMTSLPIHQFSLTWCVFVCVCVFELISQILWLMSDLRQIRFALTAHNHWLMARPSHLIINLLRYQQTLLHR